MSEILTPELELQVLRTKLELLPKPETFKIYAARDGWWAVHHDGILSMYVIRKGERKVESKRWGVYYASELYITRACVALLSGDTDDYEWAP